MASKALESKGAYTVGWIAALEIEHAAAAAMLDEEHGKPLDFTKPANDHNSYVWGRIGVHNIVIAALPAGMYGQSSATATASHMVSSFPQIRIGLMVGIGGGIPRADDDEVDIRLGDVIVSQPSGTHGGVVQYDAGKATAGGEFELRGFLSAPPLALLNAVTHLKSQHERRDPKVPEIMQDMLAKNRAMAKARPGRPSYAYQGKEHDRLFEPGYGHQGGKTCSACDAAQEIQREEREDLDPVIHYGLIASGNAVIKDTAVRDEVLRRLGGECLCVETEAAGLMNNFPCLVVRGVCDYADSHKNDRWQRYAAATAAAYAKELLGVLDGGDIEATKTAMEILPEIRRTVTQTHSLTKEVHEYVVKQATGQHHDDIEKWLSPSQPSTNYIRALEQRHPGSGRWLIESTEYAEWRTGWNPFMWLNGIPGCGKTILSSTIIEDLMGSGACGKSVLYFYFDFSDNQKQSLDSAVRTLASQLYHNHPDTRGHLDACFSSCSNGTQQPSVESLCNTFERMLQQVGEVWIVLDALDECSSRDRSPQLLPWIRGLRNEDNVHLLLTSRPEQDIQSAIRSWDYCEIIPLQTNLVVDDIASYIHAEVSTSPKLARWHARPEVQQEIETTLAEKANGMFRWVSCQLDILQHCLDYPAVQNALTALPKTLDETYSRILAQLPEEYRGKAKRLLQFLAFSERPLRVEEAVDALAVDATKTPRFDKKNRMPVPEEILRYCSSLVAVATRERGDDDDDETGYGLWWGITELRLAHFSVKDYIMSDRLEKDFAQDLRETVARAAIAETCLAYLLEVDCGLALDQVVIAYPMARFAARYWVSHALVVYQTFHSVGTLVRLFFSSQHTYKLCFRLHDPHDPKPVYKEITGSPLYYASLCGFLICVRELLDNGADVNAEGGVHGSALTTASSNGHHDIVQTLIAHGAHVNITCDVYDTPLIAASLRGHHNIVQTLLIHGADVNVRWSAFSNALWAASACGHNDVVQILLKHGAEVNVNDECYGTALGAASSSGHHDVVQTLIAHGADTNAEDYFYNSALWAASSNGHHDVVQTLIAHGADVNAKDYALGSALTVASSRGHHDIVQTLVEHGADVDVEGESDNAL